MPNLATEQVLSLVQQALNEIDDRPVDVTARRAARIASLLGDTVFAVYLGFELKSTGGHPSLNADNTRRLMSDPSLWEDLDGPVEAAFRVYEGSRRIKTGAEQGKLYAHSLAEIESFLSAVSMQEDLEPIQRITLSREMRDVRERTRHTIFTALCAWERQLTFANVNERIFERFRSRVDQTLAQGAPAVLDQFNAVYRRLREATKDPDGPLTEDLAQAVTTCRRILKAVADHLLPGVPHAKTETGAKLDESAYRNRIYQYIKDNAASDTTADAVKAALGGVYERFSALDKLSSKGVHAELGVYEAELCAIGTYLVAGELLSLAQPGGESGEQQQGTVPGQRSPTD